MIVASPLLQEVIAAAQAAGERVLEVYRRSFDVEIKPDGSPVTEADHLSQDVILAHLADVDPGAAVVAEEDARPGADVRSHGRFWLVDPLDGTKEFLSRNGEFTINIALVEAGLPALGVVYAPALGRLYAGEAQAAFLQEEGMRRNVTVRAIPAEGATVVASRSHGDPEALARFQAERGVAHSIAIGSSLKFCLVATGQADLYPRFGRTMEWDTAAGDAVLRAAGGRVLDLDGRVLRYGKPGWENPHFVAVGQEPAPGPRGSAAG